MRVLPTVAAHPAVELAEPWHFEETVMGVPGGQEVKVTVTAGPADTQLCLEVVTGRWYTPGAGKEIVLNQNWARTAGVELGDTVTLRLDGEAIVWTVVGFNQDKRAEETGVYVDLGDLDRALHRFDHTQSLQVRFVNQAPAQQFAQTQALLVAYLDARGVDVFSTLAIATIKERIFELFGVLVTFLLAMAILIALVGGLGLMGMMSINVLERSKEIGVMRAIGADTRAILQIFWGESMVVTLVSFVLAVGASFPLARLLTTLIGGCSWTVRWILPTR